MILSALGKSPELLTFVTDRPGHDFRYAIDCRKIAETLGWERMWDFERGLQDTIRWYQQNTEWLEETRSGAYRDYFDRHYNQREKTFAAAATN